MEVISINVMAYKNGSRMINCEKNLLKIEKFF